MRHGISETLQFNMKTVIAIIAGSLFLSGAAFYNGYPMVYPDTGGYIGLQILSFRSFFLQSFYLSLYMVSIPVADRSNAISYCCTSALSCAARRISN